MEIALGIISLVIIIVGILLKPTLIKYESTTHTQTGALQSFDRDKPLLEKIHRKPITYVKTTNRWFDNFATIWYKLGE